MDWSLLGKVDRVQCLPVPAVSVTAHANANTKGSWVELSSGIPFDAVLGLSAGWTNYASADFLIDLAIGAIGSEQIIANNILYGSMASNAPVTGIYDLKLVIPSGTRIVARVQSSTGGKYVNLQVILESVGGFGSVLGLAAIDTYGANTGDSGGISIDPGGSAGTKGNYVELSSGITNAIKGLLFAIGGQVNIARTNCSWYIDIAIGAAGLEQIIISDYMLSCGSGVIVISPRCSEFYPITIPTSTRLAVRARCDITDASDRLFDIVIYGVR